LALWWLHKDEDWYREMPYREKYLHWHFPIDWPEPTLIRIPRAFEIGVIFSALPEMLADAWYHKDPKAAEEWVRTFIDVANPGFMPVIPGEMLEQYANRDFFWETPIVPRGELDRPLEEQYNEYSTKAAVVLGDLFNQSPRRIDHAIRGTMGAFPHDLLKIFGLGPKELQREKELGDIPVIGRVFQRGGKMGSRPISVDEVYEKAAAANERQASIKNPETEEERQKRLLLTDTTKALSAMSIVRRYTPNRDKRQKIQLARVEIAKDALKAIKEPIGEKQRERFKKVRKTADIAKLRQAVEQDRAGEPRDRSDAIRQALITDPDTDWKDLYNSLEGASFSRGRSWKDFRKRFYTIKGELEGKE
jgi:hypothetical protein